MTEIPKNKSWLANLALVLFGIGFAALAILAAFALFPQLQPNTIEFQVKMGDIFFHHPEWVTPPDNPDEVLSRHWLAWDDDGFRVPARQADDYAILALGDSYTEASNVARPWPDVLAEAGDTTVRNLGFRGYGPVEQAVILDLYGAESDADTVIIGYFEGNDLGDAATADPDSIVLPSQTGEFEITPTDLSKIDERDERYPVEIEIKDERSEIAFLEFYLWQLNATKVNYRQSLNVERLVESWDTMRAVKPDACFILAYFPNKPHIYVPHVVPQDQPILTQKLMEQVAQPGEFLQQVDNDTDFPRLLNRLDNQRDVIAEKADEADLIFFDLTPVLAEAAASGELVYYVYDTHWNQNGHDVVGRALADFLAEDPCASQS